MSEKVKKLFEKLEKAESDLKESLGLTDWRKPESKLDEYWAFGDSNHTIMYSNEPFTQDTYDEVGPHFESSIQGAIHRAENCLVVLLDFQQGDGHALCVFDMDKQINIKHE